MAISAKAREILNRPDLIEKRDQWFQRLQNVFDATPDDWGRQHTFCVNGIVGQGNVDQYTEPERWVEECLEDLANQYDVLENDVYFRPLCLECSHYAVHYVDKMFGANVRIVGRFWNSDYIQTPIGKLEMPDLDKDPTWNLTKRVMQAFLDADVSVPLFGLPTIASALNIGVNLYGQNILFEMMDDPENARRDFATINQLLCELHNRCRSILPERQLQPVVSPNRTQPPGYGQLCGCTTQLVSPELYRDMIAPLDDQLLSVYPHGGMIHLCGAHTQHIPAFRAMKSLKAIQVNDRAAADLQAYFEGLREDQIIYLSPCPEMPVEKAMEITHGHRLVLEMNLEKPVLKR